MGGHPAESILKKETAHPPLVLVLTSLSLSPPLEELDAPKVEVRQARQPVFRRGSNPGGLGGGRGAASRYKAVQT